jgi:hypothetical protein
MIEDLIKVLIEENYDFRCTRLEPSFYRVDVFPSKMSETAVLDEACTMLGLQAMMQVEDGKVVIAILVPDKVEEREDV